MKKYLSFRYALVVSAILHSAVFTVFSIATTREFYPKHKYLEVSLSSPTAIKRSFQRHSFLPVEKVSYKSNHQLPPNFFYWKRKSSLKVTLTDSRFSKHSSNLASCLYLFASPEHQCWMKKIAVEKEVKLRLRLSPDGRVSWIELNSSSGNPQLDRLTKEMVARWQFEGLYQHD